MKNLKKTLNVEQYIKELEQIKTVKILDMSLRLKKVSSLLDLSNH